MERRNILKGIVKTYEKKDGKLSLLRFVLPFGGVIAVLVAGLSFQTEGQIVQGIAIVVMEALYCILGLPRLVNFLDKLETKNIEKLLEEEKNAKMLLCYRPRVFEKPETYTTYIKQDGTEKLDMTESEYYFQFHPFSNNAVDAVVCRISEEAYNKYKGIYIESLMSNDELIYFDLDNEVFSNGFTVVVDK